MGKKGNIDSTIPDLCDRIDVMDLTQRVELFRTLDPIHRTQLLNKANRILDKVKTTSPTISGEEFNVDWSELDESARSRSDVDDSARSRSDSGRNMSRTTSKRGVSRSGSSRSMPRTASGKQPEQSGSSRSMERTASSRGNMTRSKSGRNMERTASSRGNMTRSKSGRSMERTASSRGKMTRSKSGRSMERSTSGKKLEQSSANGSIDSTAPKKLKRTSKTAMVDSIDDENYKFRRILHHKWRALTVQYVAVQDDGTKTIIEIDRPFETMKGEQPVACANFIKEWVIEQRQGRGPWNDFRQQRQKGQRHRVRGPWSSWAKDIANDILWTKDVLDDSEHSNSEHSNKTPIPTKTKPTASQEGKKKIQSETNNETAIATQTKPTASQEGKKKKHKHKNDSKEKQTSSNNHRKEKKSGGKDSSGKRRKKNGKKTKKENFDPEYLRAKFKETIYRIIEVKKAMAKEESKFAKEMKADRASFRRSSVLNSGWVAPSEWNAYFSDEESENDEKKDKDEDDSEFFGTMKPISTHSLDDESIIQFSPNSADAKPKMSILRKQGNAKSSNRPKSTKSLQWIGEDTVVSQRVAIEKIPSKYHSDLWYTSQEMNMFAFDKYMEDHPEEFEVIESDNEEDDSDSNYSYVEEIVEEEIIEEEFIEEEIIEDESNDPIQQQFWDSLNKSKRTSI